MRPVRLLAVLAALVAACSGPPAEELDSGVEDSGVVSDSGAIDSGAADSGSLDSGTPDAGAPDAGTPDAGPPDAGPGDGGWMTGTPVAVSHVRELRALWFSTVFNLDFPRSMSSQPDAGAQALQALVGLAADGGFNAIFFQVRPESDAWYASSREPWSRFITGTQGQNPGYDPLATLLSLAHARGVEVHAWVNPYRGLATPGITTAPGHITNVLSQHAVTYNGAVTMDPSAPLVRAWVVDEVRDLTTAYDIDGVIFDDYFYPYPGATPFPDDPQYQAYVTDGGALTKSNWRRANVNALVRDVSQAIAGAKPWVRFGIAPFGIYRPGQPAGVVGLDAYETLACDSLAWLANGWIDYVSPQLYWTSTSSGQPFGPLIDWWAGHAADAGRTVVPSLAAYHVADSAMWPVSELQTQVALTRAKAPASAGAAWFRTQHLRDDAMGLRTALETQTYAQRALPPPLATRLGTAVAAPTVAVNGSAVTLTHAAPATLRGYALYRLTAGAFGFERLVASPVTPGSGVWALSAIDKSDVESPGVVAVVP